MGGGVSSHLVTMEWTTMNACLIQTMKIENGAHSQEFTMLMCLNGDTVKVINTDYQFFFSACVSAAIRKVISLTL